jgi:hypothetical protein
MISSAPSMIGNVISCALKRSEKRNAVTGGLGARPHATDGLRREVRSAFP